MKTVIILFLLLFFMSCSSNKDSVNYNRDDYNEEPIGSIKMSIVYLHNRNIGQNKFGEYCIDALGGKTVAMESIKPWLVNTIKVGDFFDVRVGIAKCSDEDRYNKKIGREMAKSRMKPSKVTVKSILHIEDRTNFTLVDDKGNSFMFVKYASASEVFLVDMF